LRETALLSPSLFITLYFTENEIETYLATAKILNIQSNNIASFEIIDYDQDFENILEALFKNDKILLESTKIKLALHENFVAKLDYGGCFNE